MSVVILQKPSNIPPSDNPPQDRGEPPQKYELVFYPGLPGTCAGSFCILRDVFRMKADAALMTLIDSTLSQKEVVYEGWHGAVETKYQEAEAARKKWADRFPRLERVRFNFTPV